MNAVVTPEAARDIERIADHISKDSPSAADRLLADIDRAIGFLAETPGAGHVRLDLTSRSVRFWQVRRTYLIVYRELPEAIEIVRVLHGNRDVATLLR